MGEKRKNGFTLLELMIVIAIIGILAAVTVPRYGSLKDHMNLRSAAKKCLMDIRYAQQLSIDTKDKHGVFFTGTGYDLKNTANSKVIKSVTFGGGIKYTLGSLQTDALAFGPDGAPYQYNESGAYALTNTAEIDLQGSYPNSYAYLQITPKTGEAALSWTSNGSAGEPVVPPDPPGGLEASPGSSRVSLSWTASANTSSYTVKRSATDGGPYSDIQTGVTTTSYIDTTAAAGTTYYYVVTAVNLAGESASSNQASATPIAVPEPPADLTAVPGDSQVFLDWIASANATGYNVKRSTTDGGPYTDIQTGVTVSSYTDTTAANGTTYYYVVTAVNADGESGSSNQVSATPSTVSAPPTDLVASPGDGQVYLSWTGSANATSYTLKRGTTDGGPYPTIWSGITDTFFTDTTAANGTTYYYVVTAVNAAGESGNSNQASATPMAGLQPPTAPVNLTAAPTISGIDLDWSNVASADTYNVKRSTTSGGPYTIVQSGLTVSSYTDTTAAQNTTYYYVVSATNEAGESPDSAEASAAIIISTITLYPSADSYVYTSSPSSNYGTDTRLYFQGDANNTYRSYIKFDLSSISGTITGANLRIYSNYNAKVCEYPDTWTETGITANNAPDPGTWIEIGSFAANWTWKYNDVDVTSYSAAQHSSDGIASFALIGANSTRGTAYSKEYSSRKPELVVTWLAD